MRPLFLAALLLGPCAFAADKYTSTYTDMEKDCDNAFPEEEAPEGSDIPARCKGPDGYSIYESYSAMSNFRHVEHQGKEITPSLEPAAPCFHRTFGRMVEWRLRNGKPVGLIYRVTCYQEESEPGQERSASHRTGEYLVVQPLSMSAPSATLNARTSDANALARARADALR